MARSFYRNQLKPAQLYLCDKHCNSSEIAKTPTHDLTFTLTLFQVFQAVNFSISAESNCMQTCDIYSNSLL